MHTFDNRIYHNVLGRRLLLLLVPSSGTTCRAASLLLIVSLFAVLADAAPQSYSSSLIGRFLRRRDAGFPLVLDYNSPTPSPEDGPPLSAGALRDPAYLPAQIGGIVGAYALSLVLVAIALLSLTKRRRNRLEAADELEVDENGELKIQTFDLAFPSFPDGPASKETFPYPVVTPRSPRNFSYPSLASPTRSEPPQYFVPSPTSTLAAPGVDLSVDQDVVAADRRMAQQQLEDMYRYVMEQEAAKEAGIILDAPVLPGSRQPQQQQQHSQNGSQSQLPPLLQQPPSNTSTSSLSKKEKRVKPAHLNLGQEKTQSRTSSILSALKSPLGKKKQQVQGMSISSPIMTPMSGTFPRGPDGEELSSIPPRHYAPAAPPPVPAISATARRATGVMPPTPELSPNSTQSIDERIGSQLASVNTALAVTTNSRQPQQQQQQQQNNGGSHHRHHPHNLAHSRNISTATSEADPVSAVSEKSTSPLVGLPSSPKPSMTRFPSGISGGSGAGGPSLPSSPKPGATFQRAPAPSAVRTGGALPLRAYEPSLASPSAISHTTKQTTFERMGPMSPNGQRTPFTGMAVPYSPYQPFSPVIPMTPTLVTKADRKRMKRLEPKTPTLKMVKSSDEIW